MDFKTFKPPTIYLSANVHEAIKTPTPMKVDPPRFPFLTLSKDGTIVPHMCESFYVRQVRAGQIFPKESLIFGFYREGFSNKRGDDMTCKVSGADVNFKCNEMFFKFACSALHKDEEHMLKTWASKDFKECTRSSRDIKNFDKETWDRISGDVMTAGCIRKLLGLCTYDYCKFLIALAAKAGIAASDIYFFEINDNDIWATNQNSVREFAAVVDQLAENGLEYELYNCFRPDLFAAPHPFPGLNKMGVCLSAALVGVFGEDGKHVARNADEQLELLSDKMSVFQLEPSVECTETMPSPSSLKRTYSDASDEPAHRRRRSDSPSPESMQLSQVASRTVSAVDHGVKFADADEA